MPLIIRNLSNYNGDYTISISGEIKNRKGVVITPFLGNSGYKFVKLIKDGKELNKRVDKLVALNYVHNPKPDIRKEIIHLDGNKLNNLSANLIWATEDGVKFYNLKRQTKAPKTGKSKISGINVYDEYTKSTYIYKSPKEASEKLGIPASKIRAALRKKTKISNYSFSL